MLSNASYLVDDMIAYWNILDGNKCPSKSVQDEGIEACYLRIKRAFSDH